MTRTTQSDAGTRVLVIEDDEHLRDLLEVVLDLEDGIEVVTLGDERKALDVCRSYHPDVVVVDVRMPHLTGEKVAAQLRSEQPGVKIISMSGFDQSERPWADDQVAKTATFLPDLRRALAHEEETSLES